MNEAAIVISENHYNALGVIRSLGEARIPVYLVLISNNENNFISFSRYVIKTYIVDHSSKLIIEKIKNIISDEKKYFLFPLSDYTAAIIDKNYDDFPANVICPNMQGNMMQFEDKSISKIKAEESGLRTAKSEVYNFSGVSEWSKFPAIVKPLISQEGAKGDICIANNSDELKLILIEFSAKKYKRVLIEEYLTGKEECMIEVLGCSWLEQVYLAAIIKKIREFPMRRGSTSFAQIVNEHDGLDVDRVVSYIKKCKFNGLFDVEFKYVNGLCYFIECNFRNGAPSYALTMYGSNLPVNWINMVKGDNIVPISYMKDNMFFMCEQTDFLNVLKNEVSFFSWLSDFRHSKKIFYNINDKAPVLKYYKDFTMTIIKRQFRRRHRE